MAKLPSIHPLLELRGTPRACGREYGQHNAESIEAFLHMEVAPNPRRLRYAEACWKHLKKWDRHVVEFVRGMAQGSGLTEIELTLLLLHEEIAHTKHCTAIGATGAATADGQAIIGQNWDWATRLYPWSGLLRLRSDRAPAAMLYSYPGLWACAGVNEHGLSLVWTGAGSIANARPRPGIPTYALIAGVLACRDCESALALLRRTVHAGFFIFILADAGGEVWVVEGWPGRFEAVPCDDGVIVRANHYACASAVAATGMKVRRSKPDVNTHHREARMATLARRWSGRIDAARVEAFLSDQGVGDGKNICQVPRGPRRCLTLDSLYCLPRRRELWIARGLPTRHVFSKYHAARA